MRKNRMKNTLSVFTLLFSLSMVSAKAISSTRNTTVSDTMPPKINSITIISSQKIDIVFNEWVDSASAQNASHYFLSNYMGNPTIALRDAINKSLVHLTFSAEIPARINMQLVIMGMKDIYGNISSSLNGQFVHYIPLSYDVVIDEIMADPVPTVGLPNSEWLELKNTTNFPIDLSGWKIAKNNTLSGSMRSFLLQPDSFVIICSTGSISELLQFGACIAVTNFPTLNNTGDLIYLVAPNKKNIHAVQYNDTWYQNEVKRQGGWSLEMIDMNSPCAGKENWSASKAIHGGTPGKINSIDAINIDNISPRVLRSLVNDSTHVSLFFNEPLDSVLASSVNNYSLSEGLNHPTIATPIGPLFDVVLLSLSFPVQKNKTYEVRLTGISDCIGNEVNVNSTVKFALDQTSDSLDIVINEILFNPRENGADFVELYNRSKKPINLKNLYLANKNAYGSIDNITSITTTDNILFPDEYVVVTDNISSILSNYFVLTTERMLEVASMPSYNNDKGTVVLLNREGQKIDEVTYDQSWHFKLLDNDEGVSLEKIHCDESSQNQDNWHSASGTSGYATPTYKNSQSNNFVSFEEEVDVYPKIISPDNDGVDDIASFNYSFSKNGYVLNATVFNVNGKIVKHLLQNRLSGTKGLFSWDGLDDFHKKLPTGIYVVLIEAYNTLGEIVKCKKTLVVM